MSAQILTHRVLTPWGNEDEWAPSDLIAVTVNDAEYLTDRFLLIRHDRIHLDGEQHISTRIENDEAREKIADWLSETPTPGRADLPRLSPIYVALILDAGYQLLPTASERWLIRDGDETVGAVMSMRHDPKHGPLDRFIATTALPGDDLTETRRVHDIISAATIDDRLAWAAAHEVATTGRTR